MVKKTIYFLTLSFMTVFSGSFAEELSQEEIITLSKIEEQAEPIIQKIFDDEYVDQAIINEVKETINTNIELCAKVASSEKGEELIEEAIEVIQEEPEIVEEIEKTFPCEDCEDIEALDFQEENFITELEAEIKQNNIEEIINSVVSDLVEELDVADQENEMKTIKKVHLFWELPQEEKINLIKNHIITHKTKYIIGSTASVAAIITTVLLLKGKSKTE